jgi:hypothetical protein
MNTPPLLSKQLSNQLSAQAPQIQTPPVAQAQTQQALPIADIHLPNPVSPWPPAIGWWLLLVLVIALCTGSVYTLKRYQKKWRYRRAALSLLKQQYQQWQEHEGNNEHSNDLPCATAMIAIVKRTAITAYSEDSAALFGQAWIEFLNQQTTKPYFSDSLAQWMSEQQYQARAQQVSDSNVDIYQLYKACGNWVKHHHVKQQYAKPHNVKEHDVKKAPLKKSPLGESA